MCVCVLTIVLNKNLIYYTYTFIYIYIRILFYQNNYSVKKKLKQFRYTLFFYFSSLHDVHIYLDNIFPKLCGKTFGICKGGFLTEIRTIICNKTPNFLGVNDSSILMLHNL